MPSRLNSPSTEGEAEAEVIKEEGKVQVTIIQMKVTDNRVKIKISKVTDNRTRIGISILKEAEGEDQMTNQAYNVINAKSMGTINMNSGRSKKINSQAEHMYQIMKEKP
jgi:hypothetical protein